MTLSCNGCGAVVEVAEQEDIPACRTCGSFEVFDDDDE